MQFFYVKMRIKELFILDMLSFNNTGLKPKLGEQGCVIIFLTNILIKKPHWK